VTLSGVAQSNERVSEFLRNLAYNSVWLTKPDLVEIVAGNVALGPRDSRRVSNFTIRVRLRRASDLAQQAASAGSAASGSAAVPAVAPASALAKPAAKT
jgi:type IV pilus assembly protein PilN